MTGTRSDKDALRATGTRSDLLGIDESTYLEVIAAEHEIRLRKIVPTRPLGEDDPIWDLVGVAETGRQDVSTHHDRYLADAEVEQWRESS